jgi:RHS repeat-associated protein
VGGADVSYFVADIVTAVDYYAYGQEMPGRVFGGDGYMFGFNGKPNDKDWGTTTIQDYGFRIYSPALCRFLSVDPLTPQGC